MKKKLSLETVGPQILGKSQKGQDSYIKHLFDKVGVTNKYYVEFGAADGVISSNTWYLRQNGWYGLLLDNEYENININLYKKHITKDNICRLFEEFNVPASFDFLCIDIDGMDYWVLAEILKSYSPRVIMVETNIRFKPMESVALKYDPAWSWDGRRWYGASPYAYKKITNQHGYTPIYMYLDDMFVVRNDCLHEEDMNKEWEEVYNTPNPDLYNSHRGPGNKGTLIKELDREQWVEV